MHGTGQALGTSVFALRQAFPDILSEDAKFVLACLFLAAIVLWDFWPRINSWRVAGMKGRPRLRYGQDGRSGRIYFEDGRSRFDMYWEFGGGNVLAVIDVPAEKEWVKETGLPLAERMNVLRFVANQVIQDQTSSKRNRFEIGPSAITIFE